MDLDYNPHAERARRKSRSSTNINHLSLAPLTVKLPIDGEYEAALQSLGPLNSSRSISSYIQGKSAPTTPRLLSHSPAGSRSRSHHRRTPSAPGVHVSKSTTHLAGIRTGRSAATNGATTPGRGSSRRRKLDDRELRGGDDSDWFLRTGALMTTETREYKGQSWLVSRQSSTSLAGLRDDDDEAFERELALERDMTSRRTSRRASFATGDGGDDDFVSPLASRLHSRFGSRSQSVAGRRGGGAITPLDRDAHDNGYLDSSELQQEGPLSGPDFVNLDEKLEELERDDPHDDEAALRRLVRHGHGGAGSWIGNLVGWPLFSLQENDDEDDEEDEEDDSLTDATSQAGRGGWSARHFEGVSNPPVEKLPPPATDEGAWKDAAWLFSVATKVMF